ncbi:MAG TPA: LysM peptidoglycan-binding domain-containing protein [Verrucomicrobiae bacterium]|nr:LysM peptidoglycan-binding domain-containing protein [Verrucomicrobiae bacterium]
MPANGQLEKMRIMAYSNPDLGDDSFIDEFTAMMNPETYTLDYKIEYQEGQGHGTSAAQQRFTVKKPEEFSFEFLFDNTGIIDGNPRDDLTDELNSFRDLLVGYEGESHEPKHFKLIWGGTLFKGRCTALTIAYKLFNPDGTPIRASCKVTFKGSVEENLRVATENNSSPDLTHYRRVQAGDTLPLLCYSVYGDSSYYLQVARVNELVNFRKLKAGDELYFPPIAKTAPAK